MVQLATLAVAMGLGDKTLAQRLRECQAALIGLDESYTTRWDALPEQERAILQEMMRQGKAGIPVVELLNYMEGAAKGIDFLNTHEHEFDDGTVGTIQHCDIKPANILLVGQEVQLCVSAWHTAGQ